MKRMMLHLDALSEGQMLELVERLTAEYPVESGATQERKAKELALEVLGGTRYEQRELARIYAELIAKNGLRANRLSQVALEIADWGEGQTNTRRLMHYAVLRLGTPQALWRLSGYKPTLLERLRARR